MTIAEIITFQPGDDILASDTNDNNQFILGQISASGTAINSRIDGVETNLSNLTNTVNATTTTANNAANKDLSNLSAAAQKKSDGQWVDAQMLLTDNTAKTTITADLSNYLPDDGQNYIVKMWYDFYDSGDQSGEVCPETDIFLVNNATSKTYYLDCGNQYARHNCFEINLPVGSARWVKTYFGDANTTRHWWAIGYRRIGTNS